MSKTTAKRIFKRFQPKEKDKTKEKEKRAKKRDKENNALYQDPYEDEYPLSVPPMSTAEILRTIKDGPSLNELMKNSQQPNHELDPNKKYVTIGSAKIEESKLDKISPKTHNERFQDTIKFKTFEDFMKSPYYGEFASKALRDRPLTKEELGPDPFLLV